MTLEHTCNEKRNFICSLRYPVPGMLMLSKYLLMDEQFNKNKKVCVLKTVAGHIDGRRLWGSDFVLLDILHMRALRFC